MFLLLGDELFLDELDDHDGMGSRTVLVHESRSQGPISGPFFHSPLDLLVRVHFVFCYALHVDAHSLVLSDSQPVGGALARVHE